MPTFSPQTLLLSDHDTRIYYTDTGPHPSFDDYTTVVIVHGLGFNGHGFEILHAYAHEHGLRLVIINRRQYPGSSSYTPQEVASLGDSEFVFDHLSLTLSNFLVTFIESAGIPSKNAEGGGGLAVLGWSIGCSPTLSLLGASMPPDKQLALAPYLRNLILYDPPSFPFGLEFDASNQNSNLYNPFLDPQLDTPEALAHGFKDWIASYHPSPPPNWDGSIEHLRAEIKSTDEMISWSDAELTNIYSPEAAFVVDAPLTLLLPDGTSIFFTDTGPHPDQPDYITVVIAHGAGFNGRGFDALHDLAHRHGLRLVIINRRHYPGSSLYAPEELTEMADGEKAFARLASNIAMFLVTFIKANHIPPVKDNRGGLAVLGWSIGKVKATDKCVTWTNDQLKAMYSPKAAMTGSISMYRALPSTEPFAKEAARLALYDEATTRELFPDVRVTVIRLYEEKIRRGERGRTSFFLIKEQANHFFHYADPHGFIEAIGEAIHSQAPSTGA
ncbi:hypothetical protein ONZ45_g12034 [Pleurotus djamor]|nr:hypothetical protein ONZ45_g12034 [Pleurotus djamor]